MTAHTAEKPYPEVMAGGLRVACASRADLARLMVRECMEARELHGIPPKLVFGVNGQAISLSARNPELRRHHEIADHVHADGQPLVLAARLLANPRIPERSAVTDFFHDAAVAARAHGLRFFLLGSTEESNAACAKNDAKHLSGPDHCRPPPRLFRPGRRGGHLRGDQRGARGYCLGWTWNSVGAGVLRAQPPSHPRRLAGRRRWLFNYVSGHYKRAPRWMQLTGFEWLHRLWREPRRLFRRYAVTNPHALFLLLTRTSSIRQGQAAIAVREVRTAGSAG